MELTLPTQPTPPKTDLNAYTIFMYGPRKSGKTTFASQARRPFFLACEPGVNALETYNREVTDWETLLGYLKLLSENQEAFDSVIVDTVDNAYKYCSAYVCKTHKITHPDDLPDKKAYTMINNEFFRVMTKLAAMRFGVYFLSHAELREKKTKTGRIDRYEPTLPAGGLRTIAGMADFIFFVDIQALRNPETQEETGEEVRVIRTKPSRHYEAGDRTGLLPAEITLDWATVDREVREALQKKAATSAVLGPNRLPEPAAPTQTGQGPAPRMLPPAAPNPAIVAPPTPSDIPDDPNVDISGLGPDMPEQLRAFENFRIRRLASMGVRGTTKEEAGRQFITNKVKEVVAARTQKEFTTFSDYDIASFKAMLDETGRVIDEALAASKKK